MKLDKVDRHILEMLQENAKLTTKEVASVLGLSITPVYERIKRLERHKIILKHVVLVDRKKIGRNLIGFCNVSLNQHSKDSLLKFEQDVLMFEEVLECYHITGKFDYMIKIAVEDMEAYHKFTYYHLATLANVGNVHTVFAMNDIKYSTAYPVR
ncbi:MAG: Lrp/AsnC family transcriptional regulator [Aureispira sp.]|nr:Lrp/AsnC family transcriptional regulator [Aureispira sp.]